MTRASTTHEDPKRAWDSLRPDKEGLEEPREGAGKALLGPGSTFYRQDYRKLPLVRVVIVHIQAV